MYIFRSYFIRFSNNARISNNIYKFLDSLLMLCNLKYGQKPTACTRESHETDIKMGEILCLERRDITSIKCNEYVLWSFIIVIAFWRISILRDIFARYLSPTRFQWYSSTFDPPIYASDVAQYLGQCTWMIHPDIYGRMHLEMRLNT